MTLTYSELSFSNRMQLNVGTHSTAMQLAYSLHPFTISFINHNHLQCFGDKANNAIQIRNIWEYVVLTCRWLSEIRETEWQNFTFLLMYVRCYKLVLMALVSTGPELWCLLTSIKQHLTVGQTLAWKSGHNLKGKISKIRRNQNFSHTFYLSCTGQ